MNRRDKSGRWKNDVWIVTHEEDGTWHCSVGYSLESAQTTVQIMMMKHPLKRDMSQARIVYPVGGIRIGVLSAPEYIDLSEDRKTPIEAWAIEAPTRYQALKIAKEDLESRTLDKPESIFAELRKALRGE